MPLSSRYEVDPDDPRAPSMEVWEQLSVWERQRILAELPSEVDLGPPEGDLHRLPKQRALEALDAYFRRMGRRVYLSSELPVYYPGERMFAPDLIAVCDVEPAERMHWAVAKEGQGLDFALEVTLHGDRKKDLEGNVERFARLGIPEYFVFDRARRRLHGWQLSAPGRTYQPMVPQQGRWHSAVLGLELAVEGDRFRFFSGTALVPELAELVDRANGLATDLQNKLDMLEQSLDATTQRLDATTQRLDATTQRLDATTQRLDAAEQRAALEKQRAEQAERELAQLRAELDRLKRPL